MLFATHHRLKIGEKTLPIAYIGSVCTLEEERGKGLATQLIKKAEEDLKNLGKKGFILIAAHEGLVPFYKKMGYQLCGIEGIKKISYKEDINDLEEFKIQTTYEFDFDFINQVQRKRNNCIIHNEETLKLYTITDYKIINLYHNTTLLAQCVSIVDWDTIEILDCFSLEEQTAEILAKKVSLKYKKDVNLKYFPFTEKTPSTIEMIKPLEKGLVNEIYMSLNLDT